MVFHALGRQEDFESAFAELHDKYEAGDKAMATRIAEVYAFIGETGAAIDWLERALDEEVATISPGGVYLAKLQDDPRWDALMENAGMSREVLDAIELQVNLPD